ncbi:LysR substrate-binding domain-containing protein [Balneola sp. MJW-20]|uniref:LysR substrate-binding domain-containing protein n=1 Tax=Gracilimonas aurantiaca TaxID=3234185 RepID=UPI003464E952
MIAFKYKVFFEVAANLSFTKAAELLFISQPAVSKHIQNLENELGVALFDRRGNTIQLTSPGAKLLEYLHKARHLEKMVQSDIDIFRNQQEITGELKVGSSTTISLYVLPEILSSFHKKFPGIKILLINRNSENIINALQDKNIDLAIVESYHKINSLNYSPFIEDEIIPVCSSRSPYADQVIDLEDLRDIPLVLRERGSGTLGVINEALEKNGMKLGDLNIIARLGGTEALKNFLVKDESVGFLSKLAVVDELEKNQLRRLEIRGISLSRKMYFVTRKGEDRTGFIRSFILEAKEHHNL